MLVVSFSVHILIYEMWSSHPIADEVSVFYFRCSQQWKIHQHHFLVNNVQVALDNQQTSLLISFTENIY